MVLNQDALVVTVIAKTTARHQLLKDFPVLRILFLFFFFGCKLMLWCRV
jgi:hypothetical protein